MIRCDVSRAQVEAAVDALAFRDWRAKAQTRTDRFIALGRYEEPSAIWSEVKPVFIELQYRKCVFCERQFESLEFGRIEYDLEHFRPKSSVELWPPAGWKTTHKGPMGAASAVGYYWLAYDLQNYAASCKVCNSPLKSNYFPIAATRGAAKSSVQTLKSERAYLCYPIGSVDDDPETLVTFIATTAVPAAKSGRKRRRGEVIIDFFQLNERDQLHRERARMIAMLGSALKLADAGIEKAENEAVVTKFKSPFVPHAACVRSYRRLWDADQPLARRIHNHCQDFALNVERTQPPVP